MNCWRFDVRRRFVPYLEGTLSPRAAKRLEQHLRRCDDCRVLLARLRTGHRFAQQLRRFRPDDAPGFEGLAANAVRTAGGRRRWARAWERWFDMLTTPRLVRVLTAIILAQLALLIVLNRGILFGGGAVRAKMIAPDFSDFRPINIAELRTNTRPHIATEGYVRDVRVDDEEKTLHFKLAQIPQGPGPFVVCEIMRPSGISVPREGSWVRVYGVARYDAQKGREWNEVNPVLNIAVLKR